VEAAARGLYPPPDAGMSGDPLALQPGNERPLRGRLVGSGSAVGELRIPRTEFPYEDE
jgi:hypothetical protein